MSFQKERFIEQLMKKGDRNVGTYCSYLSRTERDFNVDIDNEFNRDKISYLSDVLQIKFDETKNTDKKQHDALKQMRQAVRKYIEFREWQSTPETDSSDPVKEKIRFVISKFKSSTYF